TTTVIPGSCLNDFTMVRTWTFTDVCGNTSSISQVITVLDDTAPVAPAAPSDLVLQCAADVPPPSALTATDNCDGPITVSPTANITPGNCLNDFTMVRTWTFTDLCGNTSSVSQVITVLDDTAPVAPAPPADLTVQCAADVPPPSALTAIDNCDGPITVSPTANITPGNCLNDFTMVRTWTFTDVCGNTSSVSQVITVLDDTAPVPPAPPADLTLQCAADVPPPIDLTANDNCDGPITVGPTANITPGSCLNDFTMVRTWTFTDLCGNTSSVSQVITILDDTAPVAPAPPADLTLQCAEDVPPQVDLTATDNCDGPITASPTVSVTPGACLNDFTMVRTWTFTDLCGNSSSVSQTITVFDDTAPVITFCPPDITVESEPGECVNLTVDIGQATATDNCIGPVTITNDAPSEYGFGDTTVTWTATDQCGNSTSCTQIVTVDKINTITTVTVDPVSQQYSDLVEFEATIDPGDCPGAGGQAAGKVEFFVGTESMGTTNLNLVGGNLVGTLVAPLLETPSDPFDASDEVGPGLKTVTAVFQNVNTNYNVANATTDLTITQEDALVDYTGQTLQATMSTNSSEATVSLCVNIQDIDDGNRGDIRNATITFMNRDNNTVIAGPLQVADLIFPGDTTLGTICYDWNVDIGNQDAVAYTVGFVIDNYYTRDHAEDNTVITVYKPKGDFITGGGFIIPDSSEGEYASTDGLKTNFGFNVKYNKKGTKVQGRVNIIFRIEQPDGSIRTYQIKSNAKPDFGVDISDPDALFAEFTSKANLKDVTDPLNPISLGGNLTLKVEMTDRGEPGDEDSIGINLTNNSGTLLYSSNWTGTSTDELILSGGNIVIHSGFSTIASDMQELGENMVPTLVFDVSTDENPFDAKASLSLNSTDQITQVTYSVYDSNNKFLYSKTLKPDEKFEFGNGIKSGMYLVIVQQGDNISQIRLIKK
ncbi:MAG: T9SS type A sorting domain-containing protein, partial [Saprospiraceae bacterium]|nr:T9SS type A sorting domain-containing protein [Saprospiraceae bacterium]